MVTITQDTKVLIIGAGVAGLALAQMLRKEDIPFEIFERDDGTRSQGWSIALDHCLDDLLPLLPSDLPKLAMASANGSIDRYDGYAIMNGADGNILGVAGNVPPGQPTHMNSASRNSFRKILMQNLNVQYKKRFVNFTEHPQGVTVHFEDGTTASGSLLVGADGGNSAVRAQLLDGFRPTPSNYCTINGNVVIPESLMKKVLARGNTGIVVGQPFLKCFFCLLEWRENGSALFNWAISFRGKDPDTDYARIRDESTEQLLKEALGLVGHFPDYLVEMVTMTPPEGIAKPPIRLVETVLPLQAFPRGHVTLMGDSVHSMVPFRGMGANQALMSACDFANAFLGGLRDGADLDWALKKYEEKAIPRGQAMVIESRATGESLDPLGVAGGRNLGG